MRERATATAAAGIAALLLAACAVGPNDRASNPSMDGAFVNAGAGGTNAAAPGPGIAEFWRGFADPALDALVERAIAANGDVRIAQARLQEARATLQGAQAALLPEIDATAGASRALVPEIQAPGTSRSQRTATVYDAGFTANWELDFFGRNRRASDAAAALVDASQAGVEAARTSITAEVARNYLDLRGQQQRLEVARRSLVNQRDALRLTSVRLDAGRGTRLDVVRAQSLLDNTEASLPVLQAAIERATYRLATLTAQPPRTLTERLAPIQPLPTLPVTDLSALPIGTPEQLLRRRPDLIAAERQLAAATANIGVARADLFPRISLSGLIGFVGTPLARLGESATQQYSLGAGLTWPLLDFGRVRARIAASEARAQQSLASYEQTVATVLEETEGALSQFTRTAQQTERLASAARNADEATRLARVRFDAGAVDFLVVLDAERQAFASRDALVQSQLGQATSLVAVYRALGGGWRGAAAAATATAQRRGSGVDASSDRPAPSREDVLAAVPVQR